MERQLKCNEIAASQHGLILRSQALDVGYSEREIDRRIARQLWIVESPGLYAVGGAPMTLPRRVIAAVLLSGVDAAASHRTAAYLNQQSRAAPVAIDIAVLHGTHHRVRPGVKVHQLDVLDASDVHIVDGIPATTPTRTLVDLAARLPLRYYESIVDASLLSGKTTIEAVRACIEHAGPTRAGMGRLRKILDDREFGIPESQLERVFLALAKRYKWPKFQRQQPQGERRSRVDFALPELGIVVEVDGRIWHGSAEAFRKDPRRQNDLVLSRKLVLRFTWYDVTEDHGYVDREIRRAISLALEYTAHRSGG